MPVLAASESNFLETELSVVILLATAALVAVIVRRIRMPYTVALVLAGLGFAFFPNFLDLDISSDLILGLLVPPLLFEATLNLPWRKLKADLVAVLFLALIGTLVGTFIVGGLVKPLVDVPWPAALAFGALISATDPVAVIAFFKTMGVDKRLTVLVEGESLFNDAIAIVVFNIAIGVASTGDAFSLPDAIREFLVVGFGGLAVGLVMGAAVSMLLRNLDDHLIETAATLALAFGSFVVAEEFGEIFGIEDFHLSGILSVVAAGLVVGTMGLTATSPNTRISLENFWEILTFFVNSMVFLLIGVEINLLDLRPSLLDVAVAVAAVLVGRFLVVYGIGFVHQFLQPERAIPKSYRHVQMWGGLRGAISLALALTITASDVGSESTAEVLRLMTFGVVLFTLLVQGTTMAALINRLGLSRRSEVEVEQQRRQAALFAKRAGRRELVELGNQGVLLPAMSEALLATYDDDIKGSSSSLGSHYQRHPELEISMLLQARRTALTAEQEALLNAGRRGLVSGEIADHQFDALNVQLFALDLIEERWELDPAPLDIDGDPDV
ncbi:MAG: Na+/H+ antiporter [Acidimicrobiales bacterium]|nr:Na+/H+ antiporter [Acidimicrobiales bacterium]